MNAIIKRFFQVILIIICLQFALALYSTADKETRKAIKFFWESETRLIRQTFTSIIDYIVNTWNLIMEKDILEMHNERKTWKTGFARITIITRLIFVRTYKSTKAILKTVLYPLKIAGSLVSSVFYSTFLFIGQTYHGICVNITNLVISSFTNMYRIFLLIVRVFRFVLYSLEDLMLLIDLRIHNISN